jgi:hypothetical protein
MSALHDERWPSAAREHEPEEPALDRLGPPGWREFAAARRRFETTLALQGLERALVRPAQADSGARRRAGA